MLFLSSYQHFGTQSQRAYNNDGIAFRGSALSNASSMSFALRHETSYLYLSSSNDDNAEDAASFMRRCVLSHVG